MSGFTPKKEQFRKRGPRLLLRIEQAERANEVAKECGLLVEIIAYEGETYTKEAPVGSMQKEETHTVPFGSVYIEIVSGVGIGDFARFWRILKT